MKTNLILNFNIGIVDHQSMSAEFYVNGKLFKSKQDFDRPTVSLELDIDLPTVICIRLEGRNENDTRIDKDGNILQDKYIHLTHIEIFDTIIDSYKIPEKFLQYHTGSQVENRAFWNRNGEVKLIIDQDDPLVWLLKNTELW